MGRDFLLFFVETTSPCNTIPFKGSINFVPHFLLNLHHYIEIIRFKNINTGR